MRNVFARGLSLTVMPGPGKRFIFLYHDISDPDAPQHTAHYSTRVRVFREQVDLLARHFTMVRLDEVVSGEFGAKGRRLASVTFDDGFLSVREEALPYLSAKGIPFAVFVNRTAVSGNRLSNGPDGAAPEAGHYASKVYLDEADLRHLDAQGVTIGSHTSSHKVLSRCGDDELEEEVSGNKRFIEGLLGKPARHLAIPYGKREHYDDRVLRFCRAAGHTHVYSTNPTYFSPGDLGRGGRPIPRLSFLNESKEEVLFYINRPLFKRIDI